MTKRGYELVAEGLGRKNVDTLFFLMGGPTIDTANSCQAAGIRMIDVRHEQAAVFMAQAYARSTGKPGVCMAASGPGVMNLVTGISHAFIDCAPLVILGGASAVKNYQRGDFQEIDQVSMMKPITKWAVRVHDTSRLPEYIDRAFRTATSGKPGPVYLDLPGDVLYREVEDSSVSEFRDWKLEGKSRPLPRDADIAAIVSALREAKRPVVLSGSGILWSQAAEELAEFITKTRIPLYTTPQGRGVLPEDGEHFMGAARATAIREADFVLVVGTRLNYVFGFGAPPVFSEKVKIARIDIDPNEIADANNIDIGIVADAKVALQALNLAIGETPGAVQIDEWLGRLRDIEKSKKGAAEARLKDDNTPIHPLRLCGEVRDFMDRDAVLSVDGQEILNFARQAIPTHTFGHRLNSGPFGTMGVGLPFGLGAKVAKPDKQVIVLHGDGSLGLNIMELDTAARHKIPVLVVVSLNGGWTAVDRQKAGRDLGYTRYDQIAQSLGCFGVLVERPEDIRPALEKAAAAVAAGQPALVNVVTDWQARATTRKFTQYAT